MPWVITAKSGEVTNVRITDRMMCRGPYSKYELSGDFLRIIHNEAIAVDGAIGQSPIQMTSLAGSGIKMEEDLNMFTYIC